MNLVEPLGTSAPLRKHWTLFWTPRHNDRDSEFVLSAGKKEMTRGRGFVTMINERLGVFVTSTDRGSTLWSFVTGKLLDSDFPKHAEVATVTLDRPIPVQLHFVGSILVVAFSLEKDDDLNPYARVEAFSGGDRVFFECANGKHFVAMLQGDRTLGKPVEADNIYPRRKNPVFVREDE